MTRAMIAAGLFAALACFGCAVAVEDPQPEPQLPEPQRDPPARIRSGTLADRVGEAVTGLDEYRPDLVVPPRQKPGDVWPYVER